MAPSQNNFVSWLKELNNNRVSFTVGFVGELALLLRVPRIMDRSFQCLREKVEKSLNARVWGVDRGRLGLRVETFTTRIHGLAGHRRLGLIETRPSRRRAGKKVER